MVRVVVLATYAYTSFVGCMETLFPLCTTYRLLTTCTKPEPQETTDLLLY